MTRLKFNLWTLLYWAPILHVSDWLIDHFKMSVHGAAFVGFISGVVLIGTDRILWEAYVDAKAKGKP